MPGIQRIRLREGEAAKRALYRYEHALPKNYWRPEDGNCLWWRFPVEEVPYIGTPDDDAFPDWATHFTKLPIPRLGP